MEREALIRQIEEAKGVIDYLCFLETLGGDHTDRIQEQEKRLAALRVQLEEKFEK